MLACNKKPSVTKENIPAIDSTEIKEAMQDSIWQTDSTKLVEFSNQVLHDIKMKNLDAISNRYIHPSFGTRFWPYGHVNMKTDLKLSPADFHELWSIPKEENYKKTWGYYDGSGEPINMGIEEYFDKFVYDIDYENLASIYTTRYHMNSNSKNNIVEVYGLDGIVEYYYPGVTETDWKALRLIFRNFEGQYFLIGVMHDQWTI